MLHRLLFGLKNFYVNRLFPSNERKRQFLIKQGARIGKGTDFVCYTSAFGSEPYLIEVGENCVFAAGVNFITHDAGTMVLNNLNKFNGKRMDKVAPIKLGNNVYMGMNSTVLPGVTIGDNVIVGTGAIVTHNVPSNTVVAGVPARVVSSLEEYYQRILPKVEPTFRMPYEEKKRFYTNKFKHFFKEFQ